MVAFAVKTPPQHGTWNAFLDVWRAADEIEVFESAWTMDHFYPLTPPLDGTHLESWTMLAALAQATKRLRLGCMVNGMHYRHPAVTANAAVTVDHVSAGRFALGLGAGWFEPESKAYGIPLGTLKERPLPIVIGGKGPKRTLHTVARFAHHWDMTMPESPQNWRRLSGVLDEHCRAVGRDPSEIRRSIHLMWPTDADCRALADQARAFAEAGVDLVIFSMRGPYEARLLEPLARALTR